MSPALGHLHGSLPTPTILGFWEIKQLQELMWPVEPQFSTKLLLCHTICARNRKGGKSVLGKAGWSEGSWYGINHSVPSSFPGGFGHQKNVGVWRSEGNSGVREKPPMTFIPRLTQGKPGKRFIQGRSGQLWIQRTKSYSPNVCWGEAEIHGMLEAQPLR